MKPSRRIVGRPRGRLEARAAYIERRMHEKSGKVILHFRSGRLMGATFQEDEDADSMPADEVARSA